MKLHVIDTGLFKLDGGAMFGVVPKTIWKRFNEPDENNMCTWAMRCMLVEYEDRKIIIDTGLGTKQTDKFFAYYYPHGDDSLARSVEAKGFALEDITDVFHSHFHFDHCGGALYLDESGKPAPLFPNAKYWTNKSHWDWALNPNQREKASFLRENIEPMLEMGTQFIDEEQMVEVFPGFKVLFVYGHTEAMMVPHIEYNGRTICYVSDMIPSHGHVSLPYVAAYDVRPLQTLKEKSKFLEEAAEKEYVLYFEHDKDVECCTVKRSESGRIILDQKFDLAEVVR